jgi:hypothetical protein
MTARSWKKVAGSQGKRQVEHLVRRLGSIFTISRPIREHYRQPTGRVSRLYHSRSSPAVPPESAIISLASWPRQTRNKLAQTTQTIALFTIIIRTLQNNNTNNKAIGLLSLYSINLTYYLLSSFPPLPLPFYWLNSRQAAKKHWTGSSVQINGTTNVLTN